MSSLNKVSSADLPDLRHYNWALALIGICEDESQPKQPGPIPLKIDESRIRFTNYQTFVQALINQGTPTLDAFSGEFEGLDGSLVNIPKDGAGN